VTKVDVGGPSEQPDGGDRLKAAFSDALKRAAVKFGVGRYLYRLPAQWVDYDPQKRQFVRTPTVPPFALPTRATATKLPEAVPVREPAPPAAKPSSQHLPANGSELQRRLQEYEAKLVEQGHCSRGALLKSVTQAGVKAGHGADLNSWGEGAMRLAVEETRAFEAKVRHRPKKEVA
jgi:hypothetical protein